MSLKNKYDYVVVRKEQSLGLSRNAFEYLLSLEKKIERLKNSQYCPYNEKCEKLYECTKQEYEDMCNANMKLSLENHELKKQLEERTKMYQNAYNYSQKMEGKAIILETQQKEFIKYLEDESKEIYRDGGLRQNIFRQILQKYKEIIGDDK